MSNSFRLRPTTLFVAGALLVPCAAFAQDGSPFITPSDSALAPVPAPVTSQQIAQVNTQPMIDTLTFNGVEITELLSMISTEFNVPIAVAGDVSGKIGVINLKNITADQAINTVTRVAKLSCQKSDGIYIISKPELLAAPVQSLGVQPVASVLPPITSSTGFMGGGMSGGAMNNGNSSSRPLGWATADISTAPIDNEPKLEEVGNSGDAKVRQFQMRIRNVKASMMAFWIDPANNAEPVDLRQAREQENQYSNHQLGVQVIGPGSTQSSAMGTTGIGSDGQGFNTQGVVPNNAGNPYINSNAQVRTLADPQFGTGGGRGGQQGGRGGAGGRGGGVFQLPEGVERVIAIDPQNVLLVSGTPAGVAQLSQTIAFLDRPLRQVEIEAQFLSIATSAAREFGLDFSTARGNFNASSTGSATAVGTGGIQLGFVRGNFQAAIIAAERSGKAKTLTAPRVLAINNLPATLTQSLSTPIILTQSNTAVGNAVATQTNQFNVFITTSTTLNVTPTINNDDTITVLMQPNISAPIGTPNALGASAIQTQFLQTIANVRDGETIALGGLRTKSVTFNRTKVPLIGDIPFLGKLFRGRTTSDSEAELIIFLTARIVRRAGDDDTAVGATDLIVGAGG